MASKVSELYKASPDESFAVIGGEGFLGQALVQGLQRAFPSHRVTSLGLTQRTFTPGYRFFRTDITSETSLSQSFKNAGATTVFHMASPHAGAETELCENVNVVGTANVIKACRNAKVTKLIFTSSVTVCFDAEAMRNVDERLPTTSKVDPPYVSTKVKAEKLVIEANGKAGLLTCSIRLCGIFGAGDRQVVPGFMRLLKARQTCFQLGSNKYLFDFVHVANVVHAHILASSRMHDAPLPLSDLSKPLPVISIDTPRRPLPISTHTDVVTSPPPADPPIPHRHNRFNHFYDVPDRSVLAVPGQIFIITNGEPVAFWSFARALWYAYNGHVPAFTLQIPETMGMALATVAEAVAWLRGIPKEECGLPRVHVQYVVSDMYFDIEKARRVLGYEPIISLQDGIKEAIEDYKNAEAAALASKESSSGKKTKSQ
ncbi:BQ5605_C003g02281 [Microbotryum silenes-dioicae]|uniref:BQ5605_C003g02281 protein n=1 Tax=Microbotryum silenes-dioicae TaxID=796604 RepID=A0A2X0P485_9BASI|nr:BQ5605_C003g02281 [Microbotryum silenes-dioicae]